METPYTNKHVVLSFIIGVFTVLSVLNAYAFMQYFKLEKRTNEGEMKREETQGQLNTLVGELNKLFGQPQQPAQPEVKK